MLPSKVTLLYLSWQLLPHPPQLFWSALNTGVLNVQLRLRTLNHNLINQPKIVLGLILFKEVVGEAISDLS